MPNSESTNDPPAVTRASKGASSAAGLLRKVSTLRNLRGAYLALRHKTSSRGADDVTVQDFGKNLHANLLLVRKKLKQSSYCFTPLRPVAIPKAENKYRPILVPTVADRVVQRAILHVIEPILRPHTDTKSSHAFQRGTRRGVPSAVDHLKDLLRTGPTHPLLVDIEDFFPSVATPRLFSDLIHVLGDSSLATILENLRNWEIDDLGALPEQKRRFFPQPGSGLPQGSILSPILANFYLRNFDTAAEAAEIPLVRYADDIAIPCLTYEQGLERYQWVREWLVSLSLQVPPLGTPKSQLISLSGTSFEYLGFQMSLRNQRISIKPAAERLEGAQEEICQILEPRDGAPLSSRYRWLSYFVSGWLASFGAVCNVDHEREVLLTTAQEALERLLRDRKLIAQGRSLSAKQRAFLGIDTLFAEPKSRATKARIKTA